MTTDGETRKVRLLFLGAGPAMPNSPTAYWDKYFKLSPYFSGDIISPVGGSQHLQVSVPVEGFRYHPFLYHRGGSIARNLLSFAKTIAEAWRIQRGAGGFDVVISPNPLLTGLTAMTIRLLTGAKVVVEMNGNFDAAFNYDRMQGKGFMERVKERVSRSLVPFVVKRADLVKLLYGTQLDPLRIAAKDVKRTVSFADYVPVDRFLKVPQRDDKYILLLGYPWYLKGVDLLIAAFKQIAAEFPEHRLKIVGWCPEGKEYFQGLAGADTRIELCDPVYYDAIPELMAGCSLYVLASRTEGIPRVLVEALACRKPVVASNVGGVPAIIQHGHNGLLFESQNVGDLVEQMRLLLRDKDLAGRLAENGFRYVQRNLSERRYVEQYRQALYDLVGRQCP